MLLERAYSFAISFRSTTKVQSMKADGQQRTALHWHSACSLAIVLLGADSIGRDFAVSGFKAQTQTESD